MLWKNQGSRLGLIIGFILAISGCMNMPSAGERMKPFPGLPLTQADPKKDDGYGGDDGAEGWLWNRLWRKNPQAASPPQSSTGDPSSGNTGIQQVAAIGPAGSAGQPYQASSIPANTVNHQVDGLVDESVGESQTWLNLTPLTPTEISENFKATFGIAPDEDRARAAYKQGVSLYKQKRYAEAAKKFKRAAARWPDSILEEDALFFQAESYFFADTYPEAQDAFGNLLKKHGNTRYLDTVSERLYKIGQYWEKAYEADPHWPVTPNLVDESRPFFDTWGNGIKAYEMIAMNDPTGPLADDSLMSLANAYFRRNRYQDAADYYDRIRTDYPRSKYLLTAHQLAMKSYEMSYQGPKYDATPLRKADKIADTLLRQFGPQLGDERENVLHAQSRIRAKLAQQDWEMAKFYEGKGRYGSARFYYQEIIKNYPGTPIAKSSQARLDEIKDKPIKEINQFQVVIDLLDPEDDPLVDLKASQRTEERVAQKKEEKEEGILDGLWR